MSTLTLADNVNLYAENNGLGDGAFETPVPNLTVFRMRQPSTGQAVLYQPSICLILQGEKETSIGQERFSLTAGDAVVVSHMVPLMVQIVKASIKEPHVALVLELDLSIIRSLIDEVPAMIEADGGVVKKAPIDASLMDALTRLFDLIDQPFERQVLAPLIIREIHFRLLLASVGSGLRLLLDRTSAQSRVATAIAHIKERFAESLPVADLAGVAGMSLSAFHTHFKTVTNRTPLQFQKDLRLMEARRLLMDGTHNVSVTAFAVGYESPTQFSREYARKFGVSPRSDMRPTSI